MTAEDPTIPCTACGRSEPRSELFGVEPDLLCASCAHGVRKRLQTRVRVVDRFHQPVLTAAMLAISIGLFVATDLIWPRGPDTVRPAWLEALFQRPEIWAGEVWRHLSVVFLHGGWLHLLMNGFALWYLGRMVEGGWGSWALLGLMVFTGVTASAAEWMMNGSGVGLSGALFGLCGFLWALRRVHPVAAAVMTDHMVRWILLLLVLGVVLSATGRLPVGNWAHGAGLASGYLMGLAVKQPLRRVLVPLTSLLAVALVVASVYLAFGTVDVGGGELKRSALREIWLKQEAARSPRAD